MTRVVSIAQSGSNNVTMRNRIINGGMVIDQRNNGASVSPLSGYCLDRWVGGYLGSGTGRFSAQQSSTAPTGFKNSVVLTVTTADASPSSAYGYYFTQAIEGYNVADLGFGTANASTVTISFWVRSSLTGTFPVTLDNYASTRTYGATYTINAANTWEQKTITIAGDTTGTWTTSNSGGMGLNFGLGGGSTRTVSANTWTTTTGATQTNVTGCSSIIGTNGATWYLTGVQLEAGTTATPFEQRLYGTELALCQRYFIKINNGGSGNGYQNFANITSYAAGSGSFRYQISLPVTMRTVPSFSQTGNLELLGVVSGAVTGNAITDGGGNQIICLAITTPSAGSAGQTSILRGSGDATAALNFSAEL